MKAKDILSNDFKLLTKDKTLSREFNTVYATDLLSQAIKSADEKAVLITLISHDTAVALAMMLDLPAIIITENKYITDQMIEKCNEENICLISTKFKTHEVIINMNKRGII